MKTSVFCLLALVLLTSCQPKINLEELKFFENISVVFSTFEQGEFTKENDYIYGIKAYSTRKNLEKFSFGKVKLESFKLANGYPHSANSLFIYVDDYNSNKYLGCCIRLIGEKGDLLKDYFVKTLGEPEKRESGLGTALFWHDKKKNQWVFLNRNEERNRKDEKYVECNFVVVPVGLRVENSKDENVFTILESFSLTHPKSE